MKNAKFFKQIQNWILKKMVYHRPMKFFMQVHIEVKSRHAKFHDSVTHSLAYTAEKLFFSAFFGPFLGIFKQKILLSNWSISWNFPKHRLGAWQAVCKILGHLLKAFGWSKPKCPKMSKNAKFCTPNIMILSSDFRFLVLLDHCKILHPSEYAYEE